MTIKEIFGHIHDDVMLTVMVYGSFVLAGGSAALGIIACS